MAPGPTISEEESFFRVAQEPNLDPAGGGPCWQVCFVYFFQFSLKALQRGAERMAECLVIGSPRGGFIGVSRN